jgi:phosphoglycolate phosphatase
MRPLNWTHLRQTIRGVAFDLDGTILDTLPDIADAANEMLDALGREPVAQDVVRSYIGDGIARLVKRLLTGTRDGEPPEALFEQAHETFQAFYFAGLNRKTAPFPGVMEGLRAFADAGLKLACITNKAERFTLPLLAAHGMSPFFQVVVSGDTLPRKKPDPMPLQHSAMVFGISCDHLLVIGDSANDVDAARAAGCPVLCVPYGYSGGRDVRTLGADAIVPDVFDAARMLLTPSS